MLILLLLMVHFRFVVLCQWAPSSDVSTIVTPPSYMTDRRTPSPFSSSFSFSSFSSSFCHHDDVHNNATCSSPSLSHSCDFYRSCVEPIFSCGDSGYPLGYGERYCTRYTDVIGSQLLSPEGLLWRDCVLVCLQEALLPIIDDPMMKTCNDVRMTAFDSHPHCYLNCGFCGLSWSDISAVLTIICDDWACTNQIFDSSFWKQFFSSLGGCLQRYGVFSMIFRLVADFSHW